MRPMPARPARMSTAGARPWVATARLAGATAVAAGAALLLHGLSAALPAPPLDGPGALRWAEQQGTASAAMALLRLGALAAAGYATVVASVGLVGNVVRSAKLLRLADRASAGLLGRLAAGALTVGVATSALTTGTAGAHAAPRPPVTMHLEPAPSTPPLEVPNPGPPRMRLEPASLPASPPPPSAVDPDEALNAAPSEAPNAGPSEAPTPALDGASDTWTVRPGDHLWAIAEAVVERAGGDPNDDSAVGRYWRDLVELNRSRLADPANADLLFAGQVVALPPLAPG